MQWRYSFFLQRYILNRDHTQLHIYTPGRTPQDEWSARPRRPLPTQCMNIHAVSRIRTRDPSKRADSGLRPRDHWDRQLLCYLLSFLHNYFIVGLLRSMNGCGYDARSCGELEVAWRPWNASVQLNSSSPHSASFTYRQSSARQSDWRFKSWLQLQAYHDSSFQKPPNIESLVYVYVVSVLWSPSSRQLTQLMPVDAVKDAVFGLRWKKLHESLRRQDLESGHAGFKIWPLKAYSDDSHGFHSFFDFHEKRPYPFRSDPSLTKHPATSLAGLVFQPYTAIISTEHQINRPANHKLNHSIGRSTA